MAPLIVVDPALGLTGAHNRGFAELLIGQDTINARGICGNVAMDDGLREHLSASCDLVAPAFDIDFYALAGKQGGVAMHWDWIYRLVTGYVAAFERIAERWPGQPLRLLHHTLSWEHATALGLAIRQFGVRGAAMRHLAFLMYSPGVDADGRTLDPARRLDFQLAFSSLRSAGDVVLFASCSEYADAYRHLLGLAAPLPLHPCFLGDWSRARALRPVDFAGDLVLYLGEIKQDKGFLQLPERLREALAESGSARRVLMQFTAVRNAAARALVDELRSIAAGHDNVEIHEGFWPDERLQAALSAAGVLRLDYEPAAYAHKTSGLLWLAAWHGLAVTLPAGGWLEREARRLGVAVIPPGRPAHSSQARVDTRARDAGYFGALFTPFWPWLERQCETPDVAAPEGPGVDVVMFWKQNDSTIYGRRNDMVARYLASRPDVRRVLVLDAPIDDQRLAAFAADPDPVRHHRWIAERTADKLAGRADRGKIAHAVFVHARGEWAADEVDHPGPGFLSAYGDFIAAEFARRGIDPARSVYWAYPKSFPLPAILDRFPPARLVLDVVDDHRAWPGVSEAERKRLGGHYRELMARADLVLANCEPVQQAMAALGHEPRLVPNGCDTDLPVANNAPDEGLREHLAWSGRTIGFVGNLEAKIDIPLLSRVAESFPDCRLVLIGSTHANPDVLALRRHANVLMPGVVPYDRLGAWLSSFDVGLIPHLRMDLTRYMNPLKAYVYLAAGVPIVATDVPNVDRVDGLVRVADDHESFVREVAALLEQGRPPRSLFDAAVTRHAWAARLAPHVDALELGRIGA